MICSAYLYIIRFVISRNILPQIPENAQKTIVNQFTATLTPVTPEMRLTAKREPSPDSADVAKALKKWPLLNILTRHSRQMKPAIPMRILAPSGIYSALRYAPNMISFDCIPFSLACFNM